jgi:hypothetical protein
MARHNTHLRESAAIDNFLAGTSQSPTQASGAGGPAAAGMPSTTLSKAEAADLAKPRVGSVRAGSQGVVPAAHQAPAAR